MNNKLRSNFKFQAEQEAAKEELMKYAEGIGSSDSILEWLETHVFSQSNIDQSEVEHVLDYLNSSSAPKRLKKASYKAMKEKTAQWVKTLNRKGNAIQEKESDVEIVLDFRDGFKIVKLLGENAYKREGFLMRHCVASYFETDDEIFSLRDGQNMPHATISKSSQQIKGKGNGHIHPKYIEYVVKFLEHIGFEVRDSEMANLGYVNIEEIKDENVNWGNNLFRGKYFPRTKIEEIKDKEGGKYQSLSLWRKFNLIIQSKFSFNFHLSLQTFLEYTSKKGNSSTVAGLDYSTVAGRNSSTVAGRNYSTVAGLDYSTVAGLDYSTVAGGNYSTVAGRNYSTVAGLDYSTVAGLDYSTVAGGNSSTVAGLDYSTVAGLDYSTVAGGNSSTVAGLDYSTVAGRNYSTVAGGNYSVLSGGSHSIIVGRKNAIIRGDIGSVLVFGQVDENNKTLGVVAVVVDDVKIKKNTFYKLKTSTSDELVEAELTENEKGRVRKMEETIMLRDNIEHFYAE